jgi:predicted lipoprotein with Yx(FWY)xxD motif
VATSHNNQGSTMNQRSNRHLRRPAVAAVLGLLAVTGISAAAAEAMTSHSSRASAHVAQATIGVKDNGGLGQILDAGSRRLTVYVFAGDHGTKSNCSGACATAWPPVTTSVKPKATGGARSAELSTTRRSGGVRQVTYKGHPLYYFEGDRSAQSAAGQDVDAFGAHWYVITAAGRVITKKPSTQSTTTSTAGMQSTTPAYGSTQTSTEPTTTTGSQTTTTSTDQTTTDTPPDEWS